MSVERRTIICRTSKSLANQLIQQSGIDRVTILPPENVDELTDEEDIDEDVTGAPNPDVDVAGSYEIECNDDEAVQNDQLKTKKKKMDVSWICPPDDASCDLEKKEFDSKECVERLNEAFQSDDPVTFFEGLFDDDIFQMLVTESKRYAGQKKQTRCSN